MSERQIPSIHGMDHLPGAPDPIPFGDAIFEIKVFEDQIVVEPGDGKFKFAIPEDLDDAILAKAEAWVTGASSSGTIIVDLVKNGSTSMLTDLLEIDAGESNSKDATNQHSVNEATATVAWGDEVWINVDNAGSGALGLGVCLYFISLGVGAIAVEGAPGPPGGVTSFEGDWSGSSVSYPAGSIVVVDGVAYLATEDHTSSGGTEPGTVGGEAVWTPLVEIPLGMTANVSINGGGYPIIEGVKGAVRLPASGTILEGTLLADVAGDLEVDVWKCDFGGYPPDVSDSITGGNPLVLSAAIKNTDTVLTGWDTAVAEDDILVFYVGPGPDAIGRLTVVLKMEKS